MKILDKIIDSIFPKRCMLCGKVSQALEKCCEKCSGNIKRIDINKDALAPFLYDAKGSTYIVELKQTGDEEIAKYFANEITITIKKAYPEATFDIVTTVPMSDKKYKELGFNHSEMLSELVAVILGVPHMPRLLGRLDESLPQHELSAVERIINAEKSYYVRQNQDLSGKKLLIIDDVITTGATLEMCCKLLVSMGTTEIVAAAAMAK